jgi:putative toxin-antitoxin system antitoxin component (TIGR02293 family)
MVLTESAKRKLKDFSVAEPEVRLAVKLKNGLPYSEVTRFSTRTGLGVKRLAVAAGIPNSTLATKRKTKLTPAQSEKLVRLERIFAIAYDVFEDEAIAMQWLESTNPYLEGHAPLELLENEPGANAVEHLLGQIEQSVY